MASTTLAKSDGLKLYSVLKVRVRETLLAGQRRIEQEKILTYWNTGKLINEHIRLNNGRANYAEKVIRRLEADLGVDETVLRRTAQFQATFPIRATWRELTWSHYRSLLAVKDETDRTKLAELAEREQWDSDKLSVWIQKLKYENGRLPAGVSEPLVEPKAGIPGLYRVVKSAGALAVDLGFASYVELSKVESRGLKEGAIVQWSPGGKPVPEKNAETSHLYAYSAELIRVVDGDTVWMRIWLAPPIWIKQKLRLRGINAPELDTTEGESAKRFVASVLNQSQSITITTTKTDKWDRYLSDVFLEMKEGEVIYLNNHLLENGHAFRSDRVRLDDWEG